MMIIIMKPLMITVKTKIALLNVIIIVITIKNIDVLYLEYRTRGIAV